MKYSELQKIALKLANKNTELRTELDEIKKDRETLFNILHNEATPMISQLEQKNADLERANQELKDRLDMIMAEDV